MHPDFQEIERAPADDEVPTITLKVTSDKPVTLVLELDENVTLAPEA